MGNDIILLDPGDSSLVTIDWSDDTSSTVTLSNVVHTAPSPLVLGAQTTDIPNSLSQVSVSGAVHGGVYYLEASATLSNGEVLNRQWPVRCFNS